MKLSAVSSNTESSRIVIGLFSSGRNLVNFDGNGEIGEQSQWPAAWLESPSEIISSKNISSVRKLF